MPPANLPEYTLDEVAKNNNENEPKTCWIIMDGKVYDVTKFLSEHPGGEQSIIDLAGQDATEAFNDVGHSGDAIEMAEEYLIGTVKGGPLPPKKAVKPSPRWNFIEHIQNLKNNAFVKNFVFPTTIGIVIYFVYRTVVKSK